MTASHLFLSILIKTSRAMKMEKIVKEIMAEPQEVRDREPFVGI